MILLDSDHITLLKYPASERGARLRQRLEGLPFGEVMAVPVIVVEEQMRGWLGSIARERAVRRQVPAYRELANLFEFFAEFEIAAFDDRAADWFDELRGAKVRIGTMEIAAIALVNDATLLSANRGDFERVPGLRLENWMD